MAKGCSVFSGCCRQVGLRVAQVNPRIDLKLLTGGGEAGQYGQEYSALVRAKEEPVLSAGGERFHRPLGRVVVNGQVAIPGVDLEGILLIECLGDRLGLGALLDVST